MGTIAGIGMVAVIIAVEITFTFIQKKDSATLAVFIENIEALANPEPGRDYKQQVCWDTFMTVESASTNRCSAGTTLAWYWQTSLPPNYSWNECVQINGSLATAFSSWGVCFKYTD